MAKKLYDETNILAIASAIRNKNGLSSKYMVSEMPNAILSIKTNPVLSSATFSSNGHYMPDSSIDGFSDIIVSVPALIPNLSTLSVSENGSFIPPSGIDGFSEVIVNIPSSPSAILISKSFSANGTYNALLDDDADGYSEVVINISGGGDSQDYADIVAGTGSIISGSTVYSVKKYFNYDNSATQNVFFPACSIISIYAFFNNSNLKAINIGGPDLSIGIDAFAQCRNLSSVIIDHCKSIDEMAFIRCSAIETISINECLYISGSAFMSCYSLKTVQIDACQQIGNSAFEQCSSLIGISGPACLSIGANAFSRCSSLRYANFSMCSRVSGYAFCSCIALESVDFPALEVAQQNSIFGFCYNLREVILPKLKSTGWGMFGDCSSLSYVSLAVCSNIAAATFSKCTSLSAIYLLSTSVAVLGNSNAFTSTPISLSSYLGYFGSIYVPASLVEAYKSAANWSYYADRITAYTGE